MRTEVSDEFMSLMKRLQRRLTHDKREIEVTDHGAGSKKCGTTRLVSEIYKNSSTKGKPGLLLYKMVKYYQPENILELGTSIGVGTLCMARASNKATVTTVEGCPQTHKTAVNTFKKADTTNIKAINSTFDKYINTLKNESFDMVFIDGHHDGDALLQYMRALEPFTHNNTLFVLDDIRWSDSMHNAWKNIIEDENYHVTIDLFRMGIVVKRHEQHKEHFKIRL